MKITRLSLRNFRNHTQTEVEPAPHLNLVTGTNGSGKTNLIDAIHYLCMSRSFSVSSDQYVVQDGEKYFMINGDFEGEIRHQFKVSCSYSRGEGKKLFVNDSPLDRFSDLIGMVPVVVLSPEDIKLTAEGPSERRAFLDGFISQISPAYLQDLISYNKIKKQRNRLLQTFGGAMVSASVTAALEPWSEQLIEAGSRIVARRADVLSQFVSRLESQYESFSGIKLKPSLTYKTFCEPDTDPAEIEKQYRQQLEENLQKELDREQTIIGPHRDDIAFFLGDMELRNYGSQGQHRLFTIALKMAQLHYFSDELDDLPIMLLDDLFGNLDSEKTDILLDALLKHPGQTFLTSASELPFRSIDAGPQSGNHWFRVQSGQVTER